MVERNHHGQEGASLERFAKRHGYMPATVIDHETHNNGMTLITLDTDPDTNIETYDDDRAPHRSGETPEWAE